MAEVLLIGEDKAHAVLLGVLLRGVLHEEALARGPKWSWVLDNSSSVVTLLGDLDLDHVVPGLRYTSSGQKLSAPSAAGLGIKLRGRIDGEALGPEASKWRQFLVATLLSGPRPDAILIARDTDGDPRHLEGLTQVIKALTARDDTLRIIIAAPHQDAEGWFVAGLELDQDGERRHQQLSQILGFDPLQKPEKLTAHPNDARTDAKRVLRHLLGLGSESRPLSETELRDHHEPLLSDLGRLRQRGQQTGLVKFLDELAGQLIPHIL